MASEFAFTCLLFVTLNGSLASTFYPSGYIHGPPEMSCCKLKWISLNTKTALLTAINVTTGLILGQNSSECWFGLKDDGVENSSQIEYTFVKADLSLSTSPLNLKILANPFDCPVRWVDLSTDKWMLEKPKLFFLPSSGIAAFARSFDLHSDGQSLLDMGEFFAWPAIIKSPIEFTNSGPVKFGRQLDLLYINPLEKPSPGPIDVNQFRLSRHFMFVNCTQVIEDKFFVNLHSILFNETALLDQSTGRKVASTSINNTSEFKETWNVSWNGTTKFSLKINLTRTLPFAGVEKSVQKFLERSQNSLLHLIYKNCSKNLMSLLEMKNHFKVDASAPIKFGQRVTIEPFSACEVSTMVKPFSGHFPVKVLFEVGPVQGEEEAINVSTIAQMMRKDGFHVEDEDARLLVTITGHMDVNTNVKDTFKLSCQRIY